MKSSVDAALSNTPTALKILKDVAETLTNVPYIKTIAGVSVQILEIRDQVVSNKDLCNRLIDNVATRSTALIEALEQVKTNSSMKLNDLEKDLKRYKNLLIDIHGSLLSLTATGLAKTVFKRDEVKKKLQDYSNRLTDFDGVFILSLIFATRILGLDVSQFTRLVNIESKIDRLGAHTPAVSPPPTTGSLLPPPPASNFFTGRNNVLTKMDNYFSLSTASVLSKRQRTFALYGMGGAGKTQIALRFIEKYSERFSKIYFVDASTNETLTAAFENIGSDARLSQPTAIATLQWLSNLREEWLLFFDNADDPSIDLRQVIPACTHGNILITTRNPDMRRHAPDGHYHVGGLELTEALSLLRRSAVITASDPDERCATELAEELGFLALAIVQAGGFISSSPGMTFERYLELYKANRTELLSENSGQKVDGYQWTVYTTWEMSFRKLDSLAAQVLQISSFWHHDKIPKSIFQHAVTEVQRPDPLSDSSGWDDAVDLVANFQNTSREWNELAFQKVINQLHSFSLITSYWDDCYSIHPLVHSWARDRAETQKDHYAVLAACLLALCVPDYAFRTHIGIHLRAWMTVQRDIYTCLDAKLAFHLGKVCLHNSWWSEAEQLLIFASEGSDGNIAVLERLGSLRLSMGRLEDAEKLLSSAVDKASQWYGEESSGTLHLTATLAVVYHAQGRLDEAAELERIVLEKRKKILGEHHSATLDAIFHLGSSYTEQGRFKMAEELLTSALERLKQIYGEEHPNVLYCMTNLATNYLSQNRLAEAEKMQVEALEGAKRVLGDDHRDTIAMATHLADIYVAQDRLAEAQAILEEMVSKRKTILGKDHLHTKESIRDLEYVKAKQMEVTSVRPKSRRYAWMRALVKVFPVADRRQRPS